MYPFPMFIVKNMGDGNFCLIFQIIEYEFTQKAIVYKKKLYLLCLY